MVSTSRLATRTARNPRREGPPGHRQFFGHGIYGPEGRRLGLLVIGRAGRPGSNDSYAIVELSGYSANGGEMRAVPVSRLSYEADRDIMLCDLTEVALRAAPAYGGPADWLDTRWTNRLEAYFARLGSGQPETDAN